MKGILLRKPKNAVKNRRRIFIPGLLIILLLSAWDKTGNTQNLSIANADGSALATKYCWEDSSYTLTGTPLGGTFSGCGITEADGTWYFNPAVATDGVTIFPYQCNITYTATDGAALTKTVLIWKPVVITPPLQDSFTCSGQIHLEAYTLYAGAYDYQWMPAGPLERPDTSITDGYINQSTTFVITARDYTSNCIGSDTVTITRYPKPEVSIRSDTTILARGAVPLWATGGVSYQWSPAYWLDADDIQQPLAHPQQPVTYKVMVTNEYGCADSDSVHINIIDGLLLPNAFTPNGDGVNDVFKLVNYGYEEVVDFSIYNRWGQRVFITYDGTQGWDGSLKGRPADAGNYFYNIRLVRPDGIHVDFKGSFLLVR